ncbi:AMP-binding protein (plasmid) [Salipiger sp. H15]|uniref:AMP-binding protein n=1 Tax=Alloyangia sp. H15 TaxID=3029062 RepID=A0AAU8ATC0_9RHOB
MIIDSERFSAQIGILMTAMLGALNDNLVKAAIIVFAALTVPAEQAAQVGLMAGGLLVLPFVLFSGLAGAAADRFEKAGLIRLVKLSELGLACLATAAMAWGSLPAMLAVVFLMGAQSAFFGPLKLGWLPERLDEEQLTATNGWMETLTFLGILGGTVAGGLLAGPGTLVWAGVAAIGIALLGIGAARMLPRGRAADPSARLPLNPVAGGLGTLRSLWADGAARRAALLSAWFWAAGSVYLSTLPAQLRAALGVGQVAVTLVMALFALGIGAGAALAARRLRGRVGAGLLLPSALVLTAATFGVWAGFDRLPQGAGLAALTATAPGFFLCAALFLVALGGGMFAVPLKSVIQSRAEPASRARCMAGLNLLSSAVIFAASGAVALAMAAGVTPSGIYLGLAFSALAALVASCLFFPRETLRTAARFVLCRWFRVEIEGAEHLDTRGPVVFVSNHLSFIDGPLLQALIERDVAVAVNTHWAGGRLLRPLVRLCNLQPIDPQSPMGAKTLAQKVRGGGAALVFPEGRISTHGGLMKVYPGTAWMVDLADAPVVRITLEGAEASRFNRRIPGLARRLFPRLRVTVAAPRRLELDPALRGGARRKAATVALQSMLEEGRCEAAMRPGSIPELYAEAKGRLDGTLTAVTDPLGNALTHRRLSLAAAAFSRQIMARTEAGERVGVLLPGVSAVAVVLMGLWRAGRVPAILNPTLGPAPMLSAIETGAITRLLTSRAFIEKAGLQEVIAHLEASSIEMLWTDDLKAAITRGAKLRALWDARRPAEVRTQRDDPAVVLFTSGTEGAPKGVVLTHGNLIANIAQLRARTDIGSRDRVLSAMPVFHSLGLTGGLLLPLVTGAPLMIYPSPLHYKVVPEMAYVHQATLILGTDTFLSGWARKAEAYDFSSVRAAIAGAEPVKPATREIWSQRFGVRILEGYGATEAGPVIALNTPMESRAGTVGRPLTGIELRLEPVPGLAGKRLWVRGPNVMAGYLMPGDGGALTPVAGGWYDTGDVVEVDAEGYVSIVGRVKRFAKIGGEMVPLAACEELAARCWPEARVAAISLPDPRKGERIVLATDAPGAERAALIQAARASGLAEIMVPSEVVVLREIRLLASGKTDYPAVTGAVLGTEGVAA